MHRIAGRWQTRALAGLATIAAFTVAARGADQSFSSTINCCNVDPADLRPLAEAAGKAGLALKEVKRSDPIATPAALLWQAHSSAEPSDAEIKAIGEYVRSGGRLIVTFDESPGTGAFRMKAFCPTTSWKSLLQTESRGKTYPAVDAAQWDTTMFSDSPVLHLPYSFPVQPFDAAERGMQQYDRYDRVELFGKDIHIHRGDPTFTRPLLNRDWQVRIRGNDVANSGLLVTGRYGAGKVAVFASSATVPSAAVWGPLFTWLDADRPTQRIGVENEPSMQITGSSVDPINHAVLVKVSNSGRSSAPAELVARVMTWQHALISDVDQTITVPAGESNTISIPLPAPGSSQYQALDAKDAFIVRLGVISGGGATIASEHEEAVDFTPVAHVALALDNLRNRPYPFKDVPGPDGQSASMGRRLGVPVTAYAYSPDSTPTATATISNGVSDIAPLATIVDDIDPGNASVSALNDQVQGVYANPLDGIQAYGVWTGKEKADNSLLLTFPNAVHINELIITSPPTGTREAVHNPGEVIVEADGRPVAYIKDYESQVAAQACAVHVKFDPVVATTLRVRLPWSNDLASVAGNEQDRQSKRQAPTLGEIDVRGYAGDRPPDVQGKLTVTMTDAASGEKHVLSDQDITLKGGEEKPIETRIPSEAIATDASTVRFFRLQADLKTNDGKTGDHVATSSTQLMSIQPTNPLKPISDLHPAGGPGMSFVVTRGFRNAYDIGTGTRDAKGNWETDDDMVWTFERQLLQIGAGERRSARQFFVTEQTMSHYCAPWSIFPNGEIQFDAATPGLVAHTKAEGNFGGSDIVQFGFGDRWDTGPAASLLYSWPEVVAFDEFLQSQHLPRLSGKTRGELTAEIQQKYESRFSAWHMDRYAHCVKEMSDAFAAVGKRLVISGQGTPLVPERYQETIAATVQGMSDDTTWGMGDENVPETTARGMATLAFNPVWLMQEVLVWGYDSAILNNGHWHAAVGSTESSRRHYADAGWRGLIDPQGHYRLGVTYGFGMNASVSWCSALNDFQEAFRMQERLALITPDAPIGAGLIIGNASWNDPAHTVFSGGGMGGSPGDAVTVGVAHACAALHELGISIPFSTNVAALANWKANTPLIILNLPDLSPEEVKILATLHRRGARMIAFTGGQPISDGAAAIFGVHPDGSAATAKAVGKIGNVDVLATQETNGGTLLLPVPFDTTTSNDLLSVAQSIRDTLKTGLQFPEGTAGYGFMRGKQAFIVVEDWREQGRDLMLRVHANDGATSATAVNVNDHVPADVKRDGDDWLVRFSTRPGDGALLCLEQK